MDDRLPSYDGTDLRDVRDNQHPGDRYLATFEDGTSLCVRHDGKRSAWQDDNLDLDPWVLAPTVAYHDLPSAVRAELVARADELHDLLRPHP